jgi:uncharacterized protein YndB with AHSA1/START domain
MPSSYVVERSIDIDAPAERVFSLLNDFHKWREWSPWEDVDPHLHREYTGSESGAGAAYAWDGNKKAGKGNMRIVEATPPSHVRIDLTFEKPFPAKTDVRFAVQSTGTGSRVVWTMNGPLSLAMRVFTVFKSMDKLIGPDLEKGLSQLKTAAEANGG